MANPDAYFKRYFQETSKVQGYTGYAEKGNEIYTYEYTNDDLVKIFKTFPKGVKKQIMDMMIRIDFKNGDMQDYVDYIMRGWTAMQRGERP